MKSATAGLPLFYARHSMTAPIPSTPLARDPKAVVDDWETLLRAVATKLRLLVGDPLAGLDTGWPPGGATPFRSGVLECAAALEQVLVLIAQQMPVVAPGAAHRRRGDPAE